MQGEASSAVPVAAARVQGPRISASWPPLGSPALLEAGLQVQTLLLGLILCDRLSASCSSREDAG